MSSASSSMSSSSSSSLVSVSSLSERLEEQTVALGSLSDAHSTVAITLHLATLATKQGIKCIALSDQEPATEKALPSIPPNWNSNVDGFCFLYSLPSTGSSGTSSSSSAAPQRLLVKSIKMDRTLLVHAALKSSSSNDASSVYSLEINVDDFVNSTELPGGSKAVDFSKIFKDLAALLALYERNVLIKVFPSTISSSSSASTSKSESSIASEGNRLPQGNRPPQQPMQPPIRPDDDHPEGFDPLRVYPRNPRMPGPFAGDIDPLSGMPGGNLMGPGNFPFRGPGGAMGPRVPGVPGMQPRFDPYGPMSGMGDPNFDEMLPPGPGGPLADIGGPLRRGPGSMGGGGLGGPRGGFGGPGGFGGGGFGGNNQFM